MKSRDSLLRLKRFDLAEKSRKVADLEHMIREFEDMVRDLDRQVAAEEDRTGIRDRTHFAYSTFAKSALQRRENLNTSIGDLTEKLNNAVAVRDVAAGEVAATENAEIFDKNRQKAEKVYSALAR